MSQLREKLRAKKVRTRIVTIDGDDFEIVGLSERAKFKILANTQKDATDGFGLECAFLCECVRDPVTHERIIEQQNADEWGDYPSDVVAAFVTAIREVVNLDREDLPEKK